VVDFGQAESIGMGRRIRLTPEQVQQGFDRLIVLGVKTSARNAPLSPADSAARLQTLLDTHHYTTGVRLVSPGTPTNTTEEVASGYNSQDPGYLISYLVERGLDLTANQDDGPGGVASDGVRAARALGIDPAVFAHVRNADGHHGRDAWYMNHVLWPATVGYFLRHIWTHPPSDDELDALRPYFINYVRAAGPLPTLAIGNQPYGLLPVTALEPGRNR